MDPTDRGSDGPWTGHRLDAPKDSMDTAIDSAGHGHDGPDSTDTDQKNDGRRS